MDLTSPPPQDSPAFAVWLSKLRLLVNDQVALVGTTAQRPTTGNYARRPYMDTTLAAAGKMIWRNATNTGWVDATGAAV